MSISVQASNKSSFFSKTRHPISTYGNNTTYVAFHMTSGNDGVIELVAELVICIGSTYLYESIGTETTTEEDESLSIACDLEHAAGKRLRELDIDPLTSEPCDFQTALERIYDRAALQHAGAAK